MKGKKMYQANDGFIIKRKSELFLYVALIVCVTHTDQLIGYTNRSYDMGIIN